MATKSPQASQQEAIKLNLKKEVKLNPAEVKFEGGTPINSWVKIKRLFLDTAIGSPVDTFLEVKAQTKNLGPQINRLEIADSNKIANNKAAKSAENVVKPPAEQDKQVEFVNKTPRLGR